MSYLSSHFTGGKVYIEIRLYRICSSHFTGWKVYAETWLRRICSSHFGLEVLCNYMVT